MAQRTMARMYDSYEDARAVVSNLEEAGIPHSDISLVANADANGRYSETSRTSAVTGGGTSRVDPADPDDSNAGAGAKRGAVAGGVLGGGAGLLAGIGALAIPGIGPVVAAGWLIATLAGVGVGAVSGGLVGSLTGAGVSRDEAHVYSEGVKRGSSLVTVRADDADATRVEAVLAQRAVNWQERRASYGTEWKGFDETSGVAPTVTLPGAAIDEAEASTGGLSGRPPSGRV
jgi:hypothetical protein